ncbi:uncharacterized protein LOC144926834 [Branchiostoma floridae x Branchiostoma belcheri]
MNFNVTATFTVAWTDPRLANLGGRTWIPVPAHVLWLPSVKFGKTVRASWYVISRSSKGKGTRDEEGTMTTWLSPDGQISHSIRRKLSVFCRLDLRSYPFDKQTCSLKLHGFGGIVFQISRVPGGRSPIVLDLTEADSQFVLRETELLGTVASRRQDGIDCTFFRQRCMLGKSADTCPYLRFCDTRDPVCKKCSAFSGTCTEVPMDCNLTKYGGSPDVYSTIEVRFHFQRRLPYYVLQTFIPTTTVVIVSWSSFWIHYSEASARVAIGSTTLLMLIRLGSQTMRMPHISYIRAIDIWHIGCLVFALLVTLEFAVVHFLHSTDGKNADVKKNWRSSARRRRSRVEPVQFIEERMADEVSKKDDEPKTRVKLTKSTTERPTTGGNKRSADRKNSARGRKTEKARPVTTAKLPVGEKNPAADRKILAKTDDGDKKRSSRPASEEQISSKDPKNYVTTEGGTKRQPAGKSHSSTGEQSKKPISTADHKITALRDSDTEKREARPSKITAKPTTKQTPAMHLPPIARRRCRKVHVTEQKPSTEKNPSLVEDRPNTAQLKEPAITRPREKTPCSIDIRSRQLFPFCFLLFTLTYWLYYTHI